MDSQESSGAADAENFLNEFRSRKRIRRLGNFNAADLPPDDGIETQLDLQVEPENEVGLNQFIRDEDIFNDSQVEIPVLNEGGGEVVSESQMVPACVEVPADVDVPAQPAGHAEVPVPLAHDPEEAEREQRAKEVHRANSALWHRQWVSKGVPRDPTAGEEQPLMSLRDAQKKFVGEWISRSNMPASHARRACALKAWMESDTRANLMAVRSGVQI